MFAATVLPAALDPGASAATPRPLRAVFAGRRVPARGARSPLDSAGQLGCLTGGRRCGTVGEGKVASCPAVGCDFPPVKGC